MKGYLRGFQLEHRWCEIDEMIKSRVEIGLSEDYPSNAKQLLILEDVQSIQVGELDSGGIRILLIQDVSSRGWERSRFEVRDAEQSGMLLTCRSVTLVQF